jgi:hypothetical protein
MKKSLRHDLNSLFFKINTAIQLLEDGVEKEEKELVIKILKDLVERVNLLCKISMVDLKNYNPKYEKVHLEKILNLEKSVYLTTDTFLFNLMADSIKELFENRKFETKINEKGILVEGKLNISNSIDRYIVDFIETVSKMIHIKFEIQENGVFIEWKSQ